MADISKVTVNGTEYNVKDASAPARPLGDGYSKTGTLPISSTDTISEAIGKLENNIGGGGGGAVSGVKGNAESTYRTGDVNLTCDNIGASPNDHSHGSIGRNGDISNDVTIANNDKLLIKDYSDSNRIKTSSIYFDGSTSTQCLTKAGTWATFGTSNLTLGTSSTTAAAGNHGHSGYASTSDLNSYVKQAYWTSNKTSGSLDSLSEGRVYCSSNCTNLPVAANMFVETLVDYNGSYKAQRAEVISGSYAGSVWSRYYNGSWSSWVMIGSPAWSYKELTYTPSAKDTWEYTGLYMSVDVSSDTVWEYYVIGKPASGTSSSTTLNGIALADTSSSIVAGTRGVNNENSFTSDFGNTHTWNRVLSGTTTFGYTSGTKTWYVHAKVGYAQNFILRIYYRPMNKISV